MDVVDAQQVSGTEAEELFDQVVRSQRQKGRVTYGRGLDWRDGHGEKASYDWRHMALEEAVDLSQYLCAELLGERNKRRQLEQELDEPEAGPLGTFQEYQHAALRTASPGVDQQEIAVRALGLAGEAGEVVEIVKKYIGHGHGLDREKLGKELGDVLWYVATLADAFGLKLDEIAANNIEKLRQRYPEGFSKDASRNRSE